MGIKAKTIFKLVAIVCVPLTGYLAARGSRRYEEEMGLLRATKPEADITMQDKAVVIAKSYGLAAASGAGTIVSIVAMDHISMKELAAAGALVAANKKKIEAEIKKAKAYREATLQTVGEEKESEIRQVAGDIYLRSSVIGPAMSDEVVHTFHLDWFDEDLYFDSTMPEVIHALSEINRELFDLNSGRGICLASKFFEWINHPELIDALGDAIKNYGWCARALAAECDCYWLPFNIVPSDDIENTYEILTAWYPNENIESHVDTLEAKGVI